LHKKFAEIVLFILKSATLYLSGKITIADDSSVCFHLLYSGNYQRGT